MLEFNKSQLDERHLKAIDLLVRKNYDGKLTDAKIAEECGVSRQTFYTWRKIPAFNDEWLRQSQEVNRGALGTAFAYINRTLENPRAKDATKTKLVELVLKQNGQLKDVSEAKVTVDQSEAVSEILKSYGIE